VASCDDASDAPQEDQEAIDSLIFEEYVDQCLVHINLHSILKPDGNLPPEPTVTYMGPKAILFKNPDFQALHPNFGWVNVDRVRDMLKNTTQWDRVKARYPMHRHFRSRFLAANVSRLNETVAMDTILKALW
jgi:hypothetical protein